MPSKQEVTSFFADRQLVILGLVMILLCLALIVISIVGFHITDVQVPVRYTDFGNVNTYREKWYYLLSFPLFAVIIGVMHSLIAMKLLVKGRGLAGVFLAVTDCLLVFAIIITAAVLHLVSVSL